MQAGEAKMMRKKNDIQKWIQKPKWNQRADKS